MNSAVNIFSGIALGKYSEIKMVCIPAEAASFVKVDMVLPPIFRQNRTSSSAVKSAGRASSAVPNPSGNKVTNKDSAPAAK